MHLDLVISRVRIKENHSFVVGCCVNELVYFREKEAVLQASFIEISEINIDPTLAIFLLDHYQVRQSIWILARLDGVCFQ